MSMQRGDQLYVDLNAPCKKQDRGDEGVVHKSKEINRIKKNTGELKEAAFNGETFDNSAQPRLPTNQSYTLRFS